MVRVGHMAYRFVDAAATVIGIGGGDIQRIPDNADRPACCHIIDKQTAGRRDAIGIVNLVEPCLCLGAGPAIDLRSEILDLILPQVRRIETADIIDPDTVRGDPARVQPVDVARLSFVVPVVHQERPQPGVS